MRSSIQLRLIGWLRRTKTRASQIRIVALALAGVLWVGTEVIARQWATDFGDFAAIAMLLACGGFIGVAHRLRPIGWLVHTRRALDRVTQSLQRIRLDVGVDFRHAPALSRRLGPTYFARFSIIAGLLGSVFLLRAVLPWRTVAEHSVYTPFLVAQALTWLLCLGGTFCGLRWIAIAVRRRLHERLGADRRRVKTLALKVTGIALVAFLGASVLLPAWIPIVIAGGTCTYVAFALRRRDVPECSLVWRGPNRELRAIAFSTHVSWELVAQLAALWLPLVLALGSEGMIRSFLGGICAWTSGIGASVALLSLLAVLRACRRDDPAQRRPAFVHVAGELFDRDPLEVALRMRDLRLRAPGEPAQPGDVRVTLRDKPAAAHERRWPWPTTRPELSTPEFIEFLSRRDDALCRSELLDAIENNLDTARSMEFERGQGFWLAPHQWALPGLVRDEPEPDEEREWMIVENVIGQAWSAVLRPRVRHNLWVTMDALAVDLVFVEDGVAPTAVRRVFEMLFDRYDWTPHVPLNQHDLMAIEGVRLLLHETPSESEFDTGGGEYPEPDYEDIGRARILHVFRDRSGEDASSPVPDDGAREPIAFS